MDNYRSRLIALHEAQTQKGIDKYGTVLEQNTDDVFKRLEHFRQEMLDGLNYSFWLEDEIRKLGIGKSCEGLAKGCQNCTNNTPKGCNFGLGGYTKDYCAGHNFCHHSANEKHEGCEGCANQRVGHPNGCQFHPLTSSYCQMYKFCHYVSEDAVLGISGPEVTD